MTTADKPRIFWSTHYRCWICAGEFRAGSGDTPASAYEAWTKSSP